MFFFQLDFVQSMIYLSILIGLSIEENIINFTVSDFF